MYNQYFSPCKSLDLRGEFFILLFLVLISMLISMLVFKRSFGKGSVSLRQKRKLKTRNLTATESPQKSQRSPMVLPKPAGNFVELSVQIDNLFFLIIFSHFACICAFFVVTSNICLLRIPS